MNHAGVLKFGMQSSARLLWNPNLPGSADRGLASDFLSRDLDAIAAIRAPACCAFPLCGSLNVVLNVKPQPRLSHNSIEFVVSSNIIVNIEVSSNERRLTGSSAMTTALTDDVNENNNPIANSSIGPPIIA